MPYIKPEDRDELRLDYRDVETPGELNFMITREVDLYLTRKGGLSYKNINEVVGVIECVKLEFYRRLASGYEDAARFKNGEVYENVPTFDD